MRPDYSEGGTGYAGFTFQERQEELVKIPILRLYDLHLPKSVTIVAVHPGPNNPVDFPDANKFLYLHVRSPFSILRPPGAALAYEHYDAFLERYRNFLCSEVDAVDSYRASHQ
jgi:hypothetical protein